MENFTETQAFENPKKVWVTPNVEIINDGNIESHVTSKFVEGAVTPSKGIAYSGS
jgi:hypothetical protein